MATLAIQQPEVRPERGDLSAWLAVAAGTLGAFMALLDTSIVSASLPTIQGEIGATPAEGTWVSTAYLAAEVIVIPLTVWLERLFGLRRLLVMATVLFTMFSILCGMSTTLVAIIIGRLGQGLTGGILIPTAITVVARRLPPSQQAVGIAIFGFSALFGPIVGPVIGGWITESYSWHYAFFINLPVGMALVPLLLVSLPSEATDFGALRDADWLGIGGIIIGLGALTVVLEEGHREDWFESALILRLTLLTLIGFAMLALGQFRARVPVIKLSLLRVPILAGTIAMMSVLGAMQFAQLFLVPQFLAAVAGYNSLQAGQIMLATGLSCALVVPLYPPFLIHLHPRLVVGAGVLVTAASSFAASTMTTDTTGTSFLLTLALMGVGTALTSMPLQQGSIAAVSMADAGAASALFMVSRNLGGSIGLAVMASYQDVRLEFHHWRLHESIAANALAVQQQLAEGMLRFGGGPEGLAAASRALDGQVLRQALVMSFNDMFFALGVLTMAILPLCLLLRRFDPGSADVPMH